MLKYPTCGASRSDESEWSEWSVLGSAEESKPAGIAERAHTVTTVFEGVF